MLSTPTRDELIQNIGDYIHDATGLAKNQIIRGNQNAPSPVGSYCSLVYVTSSIVGTAAYQYWQNEFDDTKIDVNIKSKQRYSYDISFHRDFATDLSNAFVIYTQSPLAQEFFQTSFFTIDDLKQIDLTSLVLSQNYEPQAIVRIDLLVDQRKTFTTNRVAEVTLDFLIEIADSLDIQGTTVITENG